MSRLKEDLIETKEQLISRGRCRTYLVDEDTGNVCLDGAVGMATIPGFEVLVGMGQPADLAYRALEESPASAAVIKALYEQIPEYRRESPSPMRALFIFNDDGRTTDQDIIALVDRAIEAAE